MACMSTKVMVIMTQSVTTAIRSRLRVYLTMESSPFYLRFSGFSACSASGTKRPSFRMATPSK